MFTGRTAKAGKARREGPDETGAVEKASSVGQTVKASLLSAIGKAKKAEPKIPAIPTKQRGDEAESRALAWLRARGHVLVERNYRVARGPSARGGEIDLILRATDGTLVFVEVRARKDAAFGGAAASVGPMKQRRIVYAAQTYLQRCRVLPPCRFDVVAVDGNRIEWVQAAFDLS